MAERIRDIAVVLLLACSLGACGRPNNHQPEAVVPADTEVASGPQRLEWDQSALEGTDVASYRFVLHIDGVEEELAATCGELLPSGSHICSADLPAMGSGRHVLTVATIHEKEGKRFMSRPSASLTIDAR